MISRDVNREEVMFRNKKKMSILNIDENKAIKYIFICV